MDGEGEYSKEKGKTRQGAIATGLRVPRDGQAGLTSKEGNEGLGCRLRRTENDTEKKEQDLR